MDLCRGSGLFAGVALVHEGEFDALPGDVLHGGGKRDEHGYGGGYTVVKDYVWIARARGRETFVPLSHPPGHAQVDFVLRSLHAALPLAALGGSDNLTILARWR
ncbi:hypothetical protein [Nitrobacter winogradskyi]|uniref:Uncharacterized protein n=2 Tax=Nitrobacter winogradskyi TaxID=913 RepID=A0ACC6ALL5_NITWI|nr:hypothetical protein [Nitrobacter winogradskyi]MCP1999760.1 hypothetical protein [Nitrobacter winogradskyi]GEC15863.1 hypothetical protein NWI01_17550 [Nitrobacter winogradskyi]